ncbi:DsbA family protein [Tomitella fengzijianii]|uniref:Disulfide bond formation protein n=1 Tax=Tomitella fengzijianii TaxID=2597660 RepID=A0A516X0U3_9ACTN|nr:thioredoxin domain-containing protein [Tomitella fengzijianii]QDQ96695.1 disulfide bond formation protein [Tomitella fengzijianii]QDQ98308.1 disulfide bond formation protein [Tomitella fengzijianii]
MAVLAVVAVTLGVIVFTGNDDGGGGQSSAAASGGQGVTPGELGPLGELATREEGDPLALGAVDAPVVLVEFADYRCPFCAKFSRDVEPGLVAEYVESGQLRIEWRDMPIYGDESMLAARAGRAAAAQGRFWEFNRALYAAAPEGGHPGMDVDKLRGFAEDAGVPDMDRFTAQMQSTEFDAAIGADVAQAQQLGIPATPAFSINGNPMLGAQPASVFNQVIDALLGGEGGA